MAITILDGVAPEPERVERAEQARHGMVGAAVDEGGTAVFDDQEGGIETRPVKAGVDGVDPVVERADELGKAGDGSFSAHRGDSREHVASTVSLPA